MIFRTKSTLKKIIINCILTNKNCNLTIGLFQFHYNIYFYKEISSFAHLNDRKRSLILNNSVYMLERRLKRRGPKYVGVELSCTAPESLGLLINLWIPNNWKQTWRVVSWHIIWCFIFLIIYLLKTAYWSIYNT